MVSSTSTSTSDCHRSGPGTGWPARPSAGQSTASSCWTWPWVNVRRNVPSVEGARTPVTPCPSRRGAAGPGRRYCPRRRASPRPRTPPSPPAFADATLRCSSSRSCSPARSANRSTGTRPADTRFGSSKTASTLCEAFTYEVSLRTVRIRRLATPILPPSKGILVSRPRYPTPTGGSGLRRIPPVRISWHDSNLPKVAVSEQAGAVQSRPVSRRGPRSVVSSGLGHRVGHGVRPHSGMLSS